MGDLTLKEFREYLNKTIDQFAQLHGTLDFWENEYHKDRLKERRDLIKYIDSRTNFDAEYLETRSTGDLNDIKKIIVNVGSYLS